VRGAAVDTAPAVTAPTALKGSRPLAASPLGIDLRNVRCFGFVLGLKSWRYSGSAAMAVHLWLSGVVEPCGDFVRVEADEASRSRPFYSPGGS
jgi:hypothetical protein